MDLIEVNYKKPEYNLADYQGFLKRYPHWKWDEEYEELARDFSPEKLTPIINPNPVFCFDGKTWTAKVKNK